MKIVVDQALCDLHGQCVFAAPQLFRYDAQGELEWEPDVSGKLEPAAKAAQAICPSSAIRLVP
jgi:ferredoxin